MTLTKAIIITIGDELLIGQTIDTNSAWMGQALNRMGIAVTKRVAIADDPHAIIAAIDESLALASIVLLTGGLGPTRDDLTKDCLCTYFKSRLVRNEKVVARLHHIFKDRDPSVLAQNLQQADVPDNCRVLFNTIGTAPGMWFDRGNKVVVSLPGVPYEMRDIMEKEVLPLLEEQFPGGAIYHKTLLMMSIGESVLASRIADIESELPAEVKLAYLPSRGFVKLRLTSSGSDRHQLKEKVDRIAGRIMERMGTVCAAEEDIPVEAVIMNLMKKRGWTLGLAESCTGGYIAHRLTEIPGCSAYFKGSIVCYSNEVKESLLSVTDKTLHTVGAVSEATVKKMAEQARKLLKVDFALSVSGILGPTGATEEKPVGRVWMAIAGSGKTLARAFHFRYDRSGNKEMALQSGLDWLRLTLLQCF